MSGMNSDQLHRSTLGVYSSLMDEFNPSLQKLVLMGNSYVQAFKDLAVTSEAYFNTLSKIGERAFHTTSSRSIGDVLIQLSENQRRLTLELEGVFRWFSVEVLQEMDNNIRLDQDYISGSRRHYEMAVHNQRQLRRGTSQVYPQDEYVQFLRQSHEEALKEEERRYRFLAEKHCGLIQSIAHLMNKTVGSLQQRADDWTSEVNATRQLEARPRSTSLSSTVGMKEEDFRKSREEMPLGSIPSRAPSPQGSISRSAGGGGRSMRALAAHQPAGSNPTLLPFTRGEIITVLVQQARNGWLYGRADSSGRQGWFPSSFVEQMDDPAETTISNKPPEMQPFSAMPDKKAELYSENKRSQTHRSQPELFPRGTNPFATVKLKPTSTNDRSAPRLYRR
ncbi:brain-specific angiogenesis inhibitor 1-associated protein 2-like protein 2 [Anabas testudineus]|uniref:brain-specific angiogenesis inhibitor 1-associated protein 2-like protein 2 n=1 Tax=Anabas testudineus TaxID=64144 RepID=UPI000E459D22|nr:brain-specific angiogenesis inhibitor 1-associated protein 2-like protein 2 [Anabas testudineus]